MFFDIVMGRKNQVGLALTPTAVAVLDELAQQMQLSRSEVLEAIAQAQLALAPNAPKWTFHISANETEPVVCEVSAPSQLAVEDPLTAQDGHRAAATPATAVAAPAQEAESARDGQHDEAITRLQHELNGLRSQLTQAQNQARQLQQQLETKQQLETSQTTPPTVPAPQSPAPPENAQSWLTPEVVTRLQNQLMAAKAAYADLEAKYQQEQQESERLRQSLSQAQAAASIGEVQLNRWQYKSFSQ